MSTPQQTTETMLAKVSYYPEDFVASSDFAIEKKDTHYYLRARMDRPNKEWSYISFQIPLDIANDGSQFPLKLVSNPDLVTEGNARHGRFSSSGGGDWTSTSGDLNMSYNWMTARMEGTFNFEGKIGATPVEVIEGKFNLVGIIDTATTDTGTGFFTASSGKWGNFVADKVGIEKIEPVFHPPYWQVVGRMNPPDPTPDRSHIALIIDVTTNVGDHDLEGNKLVQVLYHRFSDHGSLYAVKGHLTLSSLPATGRATGTLEATFETPAGEEVLVEGKFDIKQAFK